MSVFENIQVFLSVWNSENERFDIDIQKQVFRILAKTETILSWMWHRTRDDKENKLKAWVNNKNKRHNLERKRNLSFYWQENSIDIMTIQVEKMSIIQTDFRAR